MVMVMVILKGGITMKGKLEPYKDDLKRLRNEGLSFEAIAIWMAKNKKISMSATGIRNFLKKLEIQEEANK